MNCEGVKCQHLSQEDGPVPHCIPEPYRKLTIDWGPLLVTVRLSEQVTEKKFLMNMRQGEEVMENGFQGQVVGDEVMKKVFVETM